MSRALATPARSSLSLRVLSAVIFLPLVVLLLLQGGWPYLLLVEAVVTLGVLEFYRMTQAKGARPHILIGVVSSAGLTALLYFGHTAAAGSLMTGAFLFVLMMELRRAHPEGAMANIGTTVLGVFYVGWLGGHLGLLRTFAASGGQPESALIRSLGALVGKPEVGAGVVLFTFFVTWSGDTGAYFVGRAWGRNALYPSVSPKKTVEGAMGGLFAALVAAFVGRMWFLPVLRTGDTLILALIAGAIGPIGDLVESLMKRDSGLKDTAGTIPGHGGVLDRFDSLLFVSPVFYYYLKYMVFTPSLRLH